MIELRIESKTGPEQKRWVFRWSFPPELSHTLPSLLSRASSHPQDKVTNKTPQITPLTQGRGPAQGNVSISDIWRQAIPSQNLFPCASHRWLNIWPQVMSIPCLFVPSILWPQKKGRKRKRKKIEGRSKERKKGGEEERKLLFRFLWDWFWRCVAKALRFPYYTFNNHSTFLCSTSLTHLVHLRRRWCYERQLLAGHGGTHR